MKIRAMQMKDMEEVVKQAQNALGMYGRKTILFIDEIDRIRF